MMPTFQLVRSMIPNFQPLATPQRCPSTILSRIRCDLEVRPIIHWWTQDEVFDLSIGDQSPQELIDRLRLCGYDVMMEDRIVYVDGILRDLPMLPLYVNGVLFFTYNWKIRGEKEHRPGPFTVTEIKGRSEESGNIDVVDSILETEHPISARPTDCDDLTAMLSST